MYRQKYLKYKNKYLLLAGSGDWVTVAKGRKSETSHMSDAATQDSPRSPKSSPRSSPRSPSPQTRCTDDEQYKVECLQRRNCKLTSDAYTDYKNYKEDCKQVRPLSKKDAHNEEMRQQYLGQCLDNDYVDKGYGWKWLRDELERWKKVRPAAKVTSRDKARFVTKLEQIKTKNKKCADGRQKFINKCIKEVDAGHKHEVESAEWRVTQCQELLKFIEETFHQAVENNKTRQQLFDNYTETYNSYYY